MGFRVWDVDAWRSGVQRHCEVWEVREVERELGLVRYHLIHMAKLSLTACQAAVHAREEVQFNYRNRG